MFSYRARRPWHAAGLAAARGLMLALALGAATATAAPPNEGDCPTVSGATTGPGADGSAPRDAVSVTLREGMVLTANDLLVLRQLVPKEIWAHREAFFFEGMRMEIGPCYRRYPLPGFYNRATEAHAAEVELGKDGSLRGYRAGAPFPSESIDPEADDAAMRWAWNLELRFRGAGHQGRFRVVDFQRRNGSVLGYEGNFFLLPTRGRADLPDDDYLVESGDHWWIFGGRFTKPFDVRHMAWRQFRSKSALLEFEEPDDTFVYVPEMRKSRRASTSWVDGMYFPTYSAASLGGGGPVSFGGSFGGINPTASRSAAVTTHAYRGFEGLSLRPNAYHWRMRGTQDVLAPINGSRPGYPEAIDRNFGPAGLSVASDRWEPRHAVVIEGAVRRPDETIRTVTYWVDHQTHQPLFRLSRAGRRRLIDIQIFVHRFSGDQPDYPEWPGGVPALVFDPVAQVSYDAIHGGGGWRRESYDLRSLPFDEKDLAGMTSAAALDRGH
jgi:hypothetical protein